MSPKYNLISFPLTLWILLLFLGICGCAAAPEKDDFRVVSPAGEWARATPESQGLESGALSAMMRGIRGDALEIDGLVVIRNGFLVFEAYRSPFGPEKLHQLNSVTKSVVSILVGTAIERGLISGVDINMGELFPEYSAVMQDSTREAMLLEHLLTMSTGLDSRDSFLYEWEGMKLMFESDDSGAFVLNRPRIFNAGTQFDYSNQASQLLANAVADHSGMSLKLYAQETLFVPLEILNYSWNTLRDGRTMGFTGLALTAADLAKIGWMAVSEGLWHGTQVVDSQWLDRSMSPLVDADLLQKFYGYQWWVSEDGIPMGLGYAGQYLILVPEEKLVVVVFSTLAEEDFFQPLARFRSHILPALHDSALPADRLAALELEDAVSGW